MSPDDLIEAINRTEAGKFDSTTKSKKMDDLGLLEEFFGDFASQAIFYAVAALGLWFLSQKWSWLAFLVAGALLMFGIPAYFVLKRK
ncbi:hypothetical protein ACF3M1_15040 [Luteimonas sp. WGS1318]|uniref:hypothetical protein n=1 Tax=Luteimonas sp. WGS1318 TaxID=3366815 RepID=UPI00372D5066